jgi:UDPglucose 6-dehydrogenase
MTRQPSMNGIKADGARRLADLGIKPIRRRGADDLFRSVAVVGLGKLGLPLASLISARGCRVFGIDTSTSVVERLNEGVYLGPEPLVADLLDMAGRRLTAATDYAGVRRTEAAFVVVPTPSDAGDRFSLEDVLPAVRAIARAVAEEGIARYAIVLVSTVMPGACEQEVLPAIREVIGERHESTIELVYAPEFVALGEVVRGMARPIASPGSSKQS